MTALEVDKVMDGLCGALEGLPDVRVCGYHCGKLMTIDRVHSKRNGKQSFWVDVSVATLSGVAHLKWALSYHQKIMDIMCNMEITQVQWDGCLIISIKSPDLCSCDPKSFESNICNLSDRIRLYINEHAHEWKEPVSGK